MKMIFDKKGYSMIVLVIAIVVILILSVVSISSLQNTRERTKIMNFIFDMNAMEDKVKNYYIEKGTLPTDTDNPLDMNVFIDNLGKEDGTQFRSQLSDYDNEKYYYIDLTQISGISLRDIERGYIVNEGSLKVYVKNGVEYKSTSDGLPVKYFTLTADLVNGQEQYIPQDEDVVVVGNPLEWVSETKLRVVLPKRSLSVADWSNWIFKWDFGPKTLEYFRGLVEFYAPNQDRDPHAFKYGDALNVKSNGIYTIFVREPRPGETPDYKDTILNVNVTKMDDIPPKYSFDESTGELLLMAQDDETGVKSVMYKKFTDFNSNVEEVYATSGDTKRSSVEFYLMDGKGKDTLYELENEINYYTSQMKNLLTQQEEEENEYLRWITENPVDGIYVTNEDLTKVRANHDVVSKEFEEQIKELNDRYPYFKDLDADTPSGRIVVYIEDYSGNATIAGIDNEIISIRTLANSFNISLDKIYELYSNT